MMPQYGLAAAENRSASIDVKKGNAAYSGHDVHVLMIVRTKISTDHLSQEDRQLNTLASSVADWTFANDFSHSFRLTVRRGKILEKAARRRNPCG